ncbi:hypothetical protein CLAFUW4_00381 [Fulvia fulva]|uniref:Uncharacterized protein n=1 Tax=Passalora fulva TaxID=5499 RepID=A0A9Q8P4E1_PASFU|nr:uncharacterized protein CLAFUR5_00382 [Fulvia fulva]KAK4635192.1 hypothetical protein CLAFUR4_00381 [Fulvia fulva]KAK4637826.1 hypothetical protein CLAFUR0_00382 [Fulvia fulva]UJO12721.1 hypothetical protein CLAFUR5_00382 [Fulvia fulva]WPV09835.1 hypothetical protein CLAFUW4_00381 [Fulvia fulva]WPV23028.1 hypothetical protein CLAFUW7_00385 [Fulvia fulva]
MSDEELTDWEVVEAAPCQQKAYEGDSDARMWEGITPTSEETFEPGHEEPPNDLPITMLNAGSRRPPVAAKHPNEEEQSSPQPSKKDDLEPCQSCNGFHYIAQCVYTLTWSEWLDYHLTYMPSQSYGHSPEGLGEDTSDMQLLYYRAESLDDMAGSCEINYLSDTRLKADLMSKSSVEMFLDDEQWEKRLVQEEEQRNVAPRDSGDERSGSESVGDALDTMKTDFTMHLPA